MRKTYRLIIFITLSTCIAITIFWIWQSDERVDSNSHPVEDPPLCPSTGRWRPANISVADKNKFDDEVERLSTLGYLQGYHKAPMKQGVSVYDAKLAYDGLNLYNSGHAKEAGIMDMKGNILYKWIIKEKDFISILHTIGVDVSKSKNEGFTHWRRVHLYDNGDILALCDGQFMVKMDKDSNLLWLSSLGTHHHMQPIENGNIFVLMRRIGMVPWVNRDQPVLVDFIAVLNPEGEMIKAFSLLNCFKNSSYSSLLDRMPRQNELFHTNTLQIFNGNLSNVSTLFKKGNILISVLYLNTIAIIDPDKKQVIWALEGSENGLWFGMHEPMLLENGNILIFDNNWRAEGVISKSKVIEFNPLTKEVVWQYKGDKENPFFSRTCGTNQRLPNGNTLITESDNGRAFEVTREGKIVWEYVTPHRAGKNNELIATLLHLHRLDRDSLKWLALENKK